MSKLSVVSDTENKDTHCNFLHWLQILITYIYNRRALLFWQTGDMQN